MTVVTQADTSGHTFARGLWVGTVKNVSGVKTGDIAVENFELQGNGTTFSGSWGSAASLPDFSVKTTNVRC